MVVKVIIFINVILLYSLDVKDTINIRLAGMDAPEGAHFGQKGQPYYQESKAYLKRLVEGKTVTCTIRRIDMYQRAVRLHVYCNF